MAAPVCDMCGGKRGRLFTSFPVKDGELCSKCYDKMTFIIKAKWLKWFFYIYYPAHLVIIGMIRIIMYGDMPILF